MNDASPEQGDLLEALDCQPGHSRPHDLLEHLVLMKGEKEVAMRHPLCRRSPLLAALVFLVLIASRPAGAQGIYTITDLGTLHPDDQFCQAFGINNYGQVAGFCLSLGGTAHAFLWTPDTPNGTTGQMIDLGRSSSGFDGGFKVNDYGQVLFNALVQTFAGIQSQAFLWTPDTPNGTTGAAVSLGGLTGPDGVSNGYGINNLGQIAGFSYPGVCFLWTPDNPNGITGTYNSYFNGTHYEPGFGYSSHDGDAFAVNDLSQVTGSFGGYPIIHNDPSFHYTDADVINADLRGIGYAINAAGHVAGGAVFASTGAVRPFFYGGTMIDISPGGGSGNAYGINGLDEVVGSAGSGGAFMYSGGTTAYLIDLIDSGTGWLQLRDAYAINDSGQIVGVGVISGGLHAFLMTPR
jgi:probable HAF family extracellular repeat protein